MEQVPKKQKEPSDTKVLVAMSGGVDSSVTAALLKTQGFQVIGVHMNLWDSGDTNLARLGGRCCSTIDSNDARRVCDRIDIPYYVINAQEVFKEKVVDYFVHEYLMMRTPNPCVMCNHKIKFSYLFKKADELGCDFVATGHYAQVKHDATSGFAHLQKAVDPQKDQSYFLFGITQKALQRTMMPLGGLSKAMVRKLAVEFELAVAEKPDSQEICFIGNEGYKGFIEERVAKELRPKGAIRTEDGAIVGEHDGLFKYTIGQRKGLQLNVQDSKDPLFVVGYDRKLQSLVVGTEARLFHNELIASHMNWIQPNDGHTPIECSAKIRSRHEEAACTVIPFENNTIQVQFKQPQRAITPGQSVVLYRGDEVIGGGFIDRFMTQVNVGHA